MQAPSAVSALASRRHPIWPEIAEFGTTRNYFVYFLSYSIRILVGITS
ncbi:Hypothetical protein LOCK900_0659 [Lacticaseibacillus rhamnosus LOCK900]|nr:Hypothetical protein LOCK900_0659 [Lacticaseibacillus rhamnosus LOCK900]